MTRPARVVTWNGKDVPAELRELTRRRYVVEAVDEVYSVVEGDGLFRLDGHELQCAPVIYSLRQRACGTAFGTRVPPAGARILSAALPAR